MQNSSPAILWQPDEAKKRKAAITRFMGLAAEKFGKSFADYNALWRWSVENRADFWSEIWDFCGVAGERGGKVLVNPDKMQQSLWFPEARLNFAENLLRDPDDSEAIVFWGEDKVRRRLTRKQLYAEVASLNGFLQKADIKPGDRLAACIANMPEAVVGMLAGSALGAVWSSCSPDFGAQGILDRFQQIEPKIFITVDGYYYKGQAIDCLAKAREVLTKLPSVEKVIVVPYTNPNPDLTGLKDAVLWTDIVKADTDKEISFARLPFDHPLYILFSSGTTGVPKCITHSAGGTLLQHLKEHQLHSDIRPGDRVFYFTTCGWMMWNWLISALASKATLLLFDGFPFQQRGQILFHFISQEKATFFGTSAKYIDAIHKLNLSPGKIHDLAALRTVASTGSPLSPEGFDYVYGHIKQDVCLSSISGGTDIVSCFVLGSPISPVHRGEIQVPGLGMDVAIFDENGKPVVGEKGELVCKKSFPCQPVYFWNDKNGEKYHNAYFSRFDNIWCHGDYAEQTENGGFVIYGRSDATLNPGGVRIGTAEIYRQVEQLDEVVESLVIGQDWDNDVRVVLFVKLRESEILTEDLKKKISTQIRNNASPRHVPAKIIQVADIPRTKSGKIVELAVREVVHCRNVKNIEALANPEALDHFKNLAELAS